MADEDGPIGSPLRIYVESTTGQKLYCLHESSESLGTSLTESFMLSLGQSAFVQNPVEMTMLYPQKRELDRVPSFIVVLWH